MDIEFSTEPISAGSVRPIRIAGKKPIEIEIKCFTQKPPPPGFKACKECGTFSANSGELRHIFAPIEPFQTAGGELIIVCRDATGETQEFALKIVGWDHPASSGDLPPPTTLNSGGDDAKEPEKNEVRENEFA